MINIDETIAAINRMESVPERYIEIDLLLRDKPLDIQDRLMKETLMYGESFTSDVIYVASQSIDFDWFPSIIKYVYEVLEKEYHTPILKFYDCVRMAIKHEDMVMLNYFIDHGIGELDEDSIVVAIRTGQTDILQWIVENKGVAIKCYDGLKEAIYLDNVSVVRYLVTHGCELDSSLFAYALLLNREKVIDFMENLGFRYDELAIKNLALRPDVERLVRVTNVDEYPHLIDDVAVNGNVAAIEYLYDRGYLFTKKALFEAMKNDVTDMFEVLYKKLSPADEALFFREGMGTLLETAVSLCKNELFELVLKLADKQLMEDLIPRLHFKFADDDVTGWDQNCLEMTKTVYRVTAPFPDLVNWNDLLIQAFELGHRSVVKWILNHEEIKHRIDQGLEIELLRSALERREFTTVPYIFNPKKTYPEDIIRKLVLYKYFSDTHPSLQDIDVILEVEDIQWFKESENSFLYIIWETEMGDYRPSPKPAMELIWTNGQLREALERSPRWSRLPLDQLYAFIHLMWLTDYDGIFDFLDKSPEDGVFNIIASIAFENNNVRLLRWIKSLYSDWELKAFINQSGQHIKSLKFLHYVCKSIYKIDPGYDFSILKAHLNAEKRYEEAKMVLSEYLERRAFLQAKV